MAANRLTFDSMIVGLVRLGRFPDCAHQTLLFAFCLAELRVRKNYYSMSYPLAFFMG